MAQSPRFSIRNFPTAAQLGIASGVVLNQSRVTFSGGRGAVVVRWLVNYVNAGAVAKDNIGLTVVGTAPRTGLGAKNGWFDATNGRFFSVEQAVLVLDPPVGSFVEVQTSLSASVVDVQANSGAVIAEGFEAGVENGPTVTVAP